jgi:hypothetical protein
MGNYAETETVWLRANLRGCDSIVNLRSGSVASGFAAEHAGMTKCSSTEVALTASNAIEKG